MTSYLRLRASDFGLRTSDFGLQTSDFGLRTSDFRLRANLSKTYNLPSLNDLYWANLGNPNLQPESGWTEEIGLEYKTNLKSQTSNLKSSLTLYNMNIDNWIQWTPSGAVFTPKNFKKVWARGFEWSAYADYKNENWNLSAQIGYQLTLSTNQGNTVDSAILGKQLIYTPRNALNANIRLIYKNMFCSYRQGYTGTSFYQTDNSKFINPNTIADIQTGIEFNIVHHTFDTTHPTILKFTAAINNLFNQTYQIIEYTPMPGRNLHLNISIGF